MRKVTVRLPATITSFGPGTPTLSLALGLYALVEIRERTGNELIVETSGEGAGSYSIGLRHPVALALMRVFQQLERSPLGIHIRVDNAIPLASGLGAEASFWVAGIIGANNLLGYSLSRAEILRLSAHISPQPGNAIGALLGGLTSSFINEELIYRALPVTTMQLIVIVPDIKNYPETLPTPESVSFVDARHNLSRLPLLLHGLQNGDLQLISQSLADHLLYPILKARIPGINHVVETARLAGALAITTAGSGPALVAVAEREHEAVADAIVGAFHNTGIEARSWIVPIDTQGVVISAMQSG